MSGKTVKKVQQIMRVLTAVAVLFTIGSIGALDLETIPLMQGMIQAACGTAGIVLFSLFGGLWG